MIRFNKILSGVLFVSLVSGIAGCAGPQTAEEIRADIKDKIENAVSKAETPDGRDEALNDMAALVKSNPDNEEAALAYSRALRENGFAAQAITVLSPFFVRKIDSPKIEAEYIKSHLASGLYEAAQRLAENRIEEEVSAMRAADANTASGKVYYASEDLYELLGVACDAQGKYDIGEYNLRTALQLSETDADKARVMNNLALNLVNSKKLAEAEKVISQAFKLSPDKSRIGENLEWITELNKSVKK